VYGSPQKKGAPTPRGWFASIHRESEKPYSRKLAACERLQELEALPLEELKRRAAL
jgi:hypothetical protein